MKDFAARYPSGRNNSDQARSLFIQLANDLKVENPYVVPDGLARSIWEDKYARKIEDGFESWEQRLRQVTLGNFMLLSDSHLYGPNRHKEFEDSVRLSVEGVMSWSGRHLQHGDINQPDKIMDLFSNCATSPFSFLTHWKSLCGKGVSSDYSSHMRPVNWDLMPNFRLVLNGGSDDSGDVAKGAHPDFLAAQQEFQGSFETLRDALHKYPSTSEWCRWFTVEDSREGWAQVLCALETAAYHEKHKDKLFIFDFSEVRESGKPIMGHQGRPASGPLPLMRCLSKVASIKGAFMDPWKQAMFVDDYMAQCVSIGGVRRNARMAVMWWRDSNIFDFIEIKRGGHLRMANNTILVDEEFKQQQKDPRTHAHRVFQAATAAAYYDQTGEPGFCTVTNIRQNRDGIEKLEASNYLNLEACGLKLHPQTYIYMDKVIAAIKRAPYICIPNPCGESNLTVTGDDCIVGDVGLQRARSIADARRAAELMGKSLVRVSSQMPAICQFERERTNKVGVSAIGILEFFWNHFQLGFADLISVHDFFIYGKPNSGNPKAVGAWNAFGQIAQAARDGANSEADTLRVARPDTITLLKPGGTVAKVMCAMESANLPSRRYYLRYTQHPKTIQRLMDNGSYITVPNPKVEQYRQSGYPIRDISHKYNGYVVVGFPTVQPYVRMLDDEGFEDKVITANNVSVEDHYKWLRLLEHHWLGKKENGEPRDAQISYTLKYNPQRITYDEFMKLIAKNQPTIRCCTFATCSDDEQVFAETKELIENYGFAPETPITREEYETLMTGVDQAKREDYDTLETCDAGVCSIDENINSV